MIAFFYLSSLINFILAVTSLACLRLICLNQLHKGVSIIYILFHCLFVYLTYLNELLSFLFIIFFTLAFHYFLNKKYFFTNSLIYLFFYYGIGLFLSTLSDSMILINGALILTSSKGLLISLLIPLFGLLMLFSSLVVDKTFHLHNYQETIYLTIGNKTVELKGYYDTGNTLTYKNTPVIFLNQNLFPNEEFQEEMDFETIISHGKTLLAKGLVSLKGQKDEFFVYVAKNYSIHDYHGCQLLLNAYLF